MHWYKPSFEPVQRPGHKRGRYVIVSEGFLQHEDGAQIDLHQMLTENKSTMVIMPIHTNLMRNSGLHAGGYMVVDLSGKARAGNIVVVQYNGATIIRKVQKSLTQWVLVADDSREQKLYLNEFANFKLIGVVQFAINVIK